MGKSAECCTQNSGKMGNVKIVTSLVADKKAVTAVMMFFDECSTIFV
jgi:hypothetical protein